MKRILANLFILILLPFTAYGLDTISEDVMDEVSGQAGITVEADLSMDLVIDSFSWQDEDGVGIYNAPGILDFLYTIIGSITVDTATDYAGITMQIRCYAGYPKGKRRNKKSAVRII